MLCYIYRMYVYEPQSNICQKRPDLDEKMFLNQILFKKMFLFQNIKSPGVPMEIRQNSL